MVRLQCISQMVFFQIRDTKLRNAALECFDLPPAMIWLVAEAEWVYFPPFTFFCSSLVSLAEWSDEKKPRK